MDTDQVARLVLEIVSDTICPWCYIGKRKLDLALASIGDEILFDVVWRPFELNPDMPRDGIDRRAYRTAKFGSWERSRALDAQVHEAAANAGLDIRHERMAVTPNTLSSHALVRLARPAGLQGTVVETLFKAYFTDGLDIGDPKVLTDVGAACGMAEERIDQALTDDAVRRAVKSEAAAFSAAGIDGVPAVLLNRHFLFSGAQSPDRIVDTLRRAAATPGIANAGGGHVVAW